MPQFDLRKLCDKHIAGGDIFILQHSNDEIVGFALIRTSKFPLEKIHDSFRVTHLKDSNRKSVYQSVKGKRIIYQSFEGYFVALLV
jgi:hypothetical protein